MPSDHPTPLARLADALAKAADGVRPTPRELAELLWLAGQLGHGEQDEPASKEAVVREAPPPREPAAPAPPPRNDPVEPPAAAPAPDPARTSLHLPSSTTSPGPYTSLLAPAPPMLRHPLALQRSLRPLKRRTDAPSGHCLDEHATADRIARLGAAPEWWLPVLRPAQERWLRLNLVYDEGPTMPVWRPLLRELHTALAQSGVFRTVAVYPVGADGSVAGSDLPGDGRTATLLISDCMGPQWRPGPAGNRWYGTLRRWARQMPLAVVQPLPEHLWRDTALPAAAGLLSAPFPAAPTAAMAFRPYEEGTTTGGEPMVPVLEAGPRWLANWAGLVASAGGTWFPGAAAPLDVRVREDARTDLSRLPAEELVLRFRATASREAFRLAGHLAVGRPDLPVMRLVQRAVEPDPRPQHLAEVILSGVLTTVPGPPGSYAFRPGARELLLRSLPRAARNGTTELLARVGGLIEERAGAAPGEFRAVAPAEGGTSPGGNGEAFATVRAESVRRLAGGGEAVSVPRGVGGRYRLRRRFLPNGSVWLADDPETGRAVALRLYRPLSDKARREAFLRDAERLRGFGHRNVVGVGDFGIEDGTPYLAMEYVDGIPLNALAAPHGHRLPGPLLVSVGAQLAQAVGALHDAGLTHGDLGMSRVMLLPDGTVKLGGFVPGRRPGAPGRTQDLSALCEVMLILTAGTARLAPPFGAEQLRHLPESLRERYAHALTLLMSPPRQASGREQLADGELLLRAQEEYDWQRFYHVLGPLTTELAGGTSDFGPDEQAALAMLLLRHGREVTRDTLRKGLWGPGQEPPDATQAVDRTAARLREALGPGVLAALPDGYALHTSADYLDLVHCEDLERTASTLAAQGNLRGARARLGTALGLWRSAGPLPDVPGPAARTARNRLQQLRLALHRKVAELDLDLGEYERAALQLTDLLRTYPSREDLLRLLLIALQRLGRMDEALEVYEEYELAGGSDPELRAIGHELRGELYDRADEGDYETQPHETRAPDEPEGSFPTEESLPSLFAMEEEATAGAETPLPQNEVPESLFAVEDPLGEEEPPYPIEDEHGEYDDAFAGIFGDGEEIFGDGGEPPPTYSTAVFYELADLPQDPDRVPTLGRAVTRLLTACGLEPDDYELTEYGDGYSVLTRADVSVLPLLSLTSQRFEDELALADGPRWRVTFTCLFEDGTAQAPDPAAVRAALGSVEEARGIIAVPQILRDEWDEYSSTAPRLRRLRPAPDAGWYRLALMPDPALGGSGPAPPVHGPYPLPGGGLFPEPAGESRTLVYAIGHAEVAFTRTAETTGYYEVDLTERRMELDVSAGPFRAVGEVRWRIADTLGLVAHGILKTVSDAVVNTVRGRLRYLSENYPPAYLAEAQAALGDGPGRSAPRGVTVGWDLRLTTTEAARPVPRTGPRGAGPGSPLRGVTGILFGFDATLTWLHPNARASDAHPLTPLLDLLPDLDPSEDPRAGTAQGFSPGLRARLAALEAAAAEASVPVPDADLLIRTLADRGLELAVVTDCDPRAAKVYLTRRGLLDCLSAGVHGRDARRSPLMPDPLVVEQALEQLGVRPSKCLMAGTTEAEREAARRAGVPFLHITPEAGLRPLLEAARAL
ncbi:SAV_2336 N-terminal domain-related protein [Streptomyces sp. NPDC048179]|uniref:SAV_2336 N-terminal domain-related protein n=1 Tax=Streptomyces sp. NPDC048179 TaxID=3365506 RepID=UPI0037100205